MTVPEMVNRRAVASESRATVWFTKPSRRAASVGIDTSIGRLSWPKRRENRNGRAPWRAGISERRHIIAIGAAVPGHKIGIRRRRIISGRRIGRAPAASLAAP